MIDSKALLTNPLIGQELRLDLAEEVLTYGKCILVPEDFERSQVTSYEVLVSLQDKDMFFTGMEFYIKVGDTLYAKSRVAEIQLDPPLYVKLEAVFLSWKTV